MKVYTIGLDLPDREFVSHRFAEDGQVVDVTDQYQDILAMVCDAVIIIKDAASDEALNAIKEFRNEVGEEDKTKYYFFSKAEWKLLCDTYEAECNLMQEWKQWWKQHHPDYKYFNADGVVDFVKYFSLEKKVLVVLKETDELESSLSEFLYHGGSNTYYRTWNNVARWSHMIQHDVFLDRVSRLDLNKEVRNIAVMNLKKYAGGATANKKEVRSVAKDDIHLLKRQIALYKPDIILTGGWDLVSDFLHDDILEEGNNWVNPKCRKNEEDPNLWYFWTSKVREDKNVLVVSMPHPNRSAKKWTGELQRIIHKELG